MRFLLSIPLALSLGSCCSMFGPDDHEERHPNGQLARRGSLLCEEQVGRWTFYHENGERESEGTYRGDRQIGEWAYWYADGTQRMRGSFDGDRRVGDWEFWNPDGTVRARGRFEHGEEVGSWEFFDAHGAPESRGDFDRGHRTGHWMTFRPDGRVLTEGHYLDGEKIGPWRLGIGGAEAREFTFPVPEDTRVVREAWATGGNLRREGVLRGGAPRGLWVTFHANGRRRIEGRFEEGHATGTFRAFDDAGEPFAEGMVKDDRPHGVWRRIDGERLGSFDANGATPLETAEGWSAADVVRSEEPARVVATWLAEIAGPLDENLALSEDAPRPEPNDEDMIETLTLRPEAPILPQHWTVRELLNKDAFVKLFTKGGASVSFAGGYEGAGRQGPRFDREKAAAIEGKPLPKRTFLQTTGRKLNFDVFARMGQKTVVVLLRGYAAGVCIYCAAQTEALAQAKSEFDAAGAEVLVIYPGPRNGFDAFLEAYRKTFRDEVPPYKIFYDQDVELARLVGLEEDLAQPTTFVIDGKGLVHKAFVGKRPQDRPPVTEILKALRDVDAKP